MDRQSSKITAIYCRLARYNEAEGLDRAIARNQVERLTQYAAAQGLENPELFCDWGLSGITQDRPEYKRMIRAIEAGNVSDLVVLDFSRLGRGYHTCSRLVEIILPKHGVTFHAVRNGVIYTPKALNELAAQRKAVYAVFRQMRREGGRQ